MVGYLEAQYRFYISISLVGGWYCWLRVIIEWHHLLRKLMDWVPRSENSLFLASWTLTLKVWVWIFEGSPPTENYITWQWYAWVFPLSSWVFCFFFIWFVEIILLRLFGFKPSSPERKEINSPLLEKMPWRKFGMISRVTLEGCRNDFNEFWIYFDSNFERQTWWYCYTVTYASVIETLKGHIFNWKAYVFEFELQDTKHWY